MSIRMRLTLWHTGLFGLALAIFALLVYVAVARQLASQLEYVVHMQALQVSRDIHTVSIGDPVIQGRGIALPATPPFSNSTVYLQLVDSTGGVLAASPNLKQPLPSPTVAVNSAAANQDLHQTLTMPDERLDVYSTPLLVDDKPIGILQVAASLQPLDASLMQLRLILVGIVLGATAVAAVLGWVLATAAMRPVDRITRAAKAIGESVDFAQRLTLPRQRDELGRLTLTFNEMLDKLQEAFASQRRFLADVSHELRTPLAAIRTHLEVSLRAGDRNGNALQETLPAVLREADRLGRLVADLLILARAQEGQRIARQPVALDRLLLEVYQQQKRLTNGQELTIDELEQAEVEGDVDRLKQLLLNLVDNALRHAPAGPVRLGLTVKNGWAALRVSDAGPGIAPEHLPHLFDRFYRVNPQASAGDSGAGLGLAICRWIAEAHDGRIEVNSQDGAGSTFTLWLKASAETSRCTAAATAVA